MSSSDEYDYESHRKRSHHKKHHHHHESRHSSSSRSRAHEERRRHDDDRDRREYSHHRQESSRTRSPSPNSTLPRSMFDSPERTLVAKPKKEGDVIENMETSFTDGPLDVLKRCLHDRQKVMVWIRNQKGIRGICTGFVLAFDKFWNLVMDDVDEVYQKPFNPKTPFLQSVCHNLPEAGALKKKKKPVGKPLDQAPKTDAEVSDLILEIREKRRKRKEEEKKQRAKERAAVCKRHIQKMFVRGDNVVLVRVC